MSERFDGKVAVITGAAGGIGSAAARRFAADGARVVLVDLDEAQLRGVAEAVAREGGEAHAVAADVTRASEVERYVQEAQSRFGGIDCFFNNAGIEGFIGSMLEYPEETFDRVLAVNTKGVWLGMRAVIPAMRARSGGAIVNTASTAGLSGSPMLSAYSASKHAVIGLTRSAALEFAGDGIRVNAVCPSPIETRMMRSLERGIDAGSPEAVKQRLAAANPMGRYGEPEEVGGGRRVSVQR